MGSTSTYLDDIDEIEKLIAFMRELIANQLECYEKIRRSHEECTPSWRGTIRKSFEGKIDEFLERTKVIQADSEMLFAWAEKFMALAHEREDIMTR